MHTQLIEPNGQPYIYCEKCRVAVVLPEHASPEEKHLFARLRREDPVQAMRVAETQFALGPREAKALVLHVTSDAGKCNRCEKPSPPGESLCSCRSANLDW